MERFLKGIYTVLLIFTFLTVTVGIAFAEETATAPGIEEVALNALSENNTMNLVYTANNQGVGWDSTVGNSGISGDPDADLQAFAISIPESLGTIQYRALVDGDGWQNWTSKENYTGSIEPGKRIKAIQMQLAEGAEEQFDLYYKVNIDGIGWTDWAMNGESAGSIDTDNAIREIQVTYSSKGDPTPVAQEEPVFTPQELQQLQNVEYSTHVSFQGWQDFVSNGQTAGTTGLSLSIEALKVNIPKISEISNDSAVNYRVYSQYVGWSATKKNGEEAGTTGQSLNAEAFEIHLSGQVANVFDIYYRVHSAYYGWLDWAKNGETAGTTGLNTRAEALEIRLVPKNGNAPGKTERPVVTYEKLQARNQINYNTNITGMGWQQGFSNGMDAGTIGQSLQIQAFTVDMPNHVNGSQLNYQAHVSNVGWMDPVTDGKMTGATDGNSSIEAITIALTGEDAYSYDVYYQVHSQDYGWLGWAKNGEYAGTTGGGLRMEALRIKLVPHNGPAPGSTENAYVDVVQPDKNWLWPLDGIYNISSGFGYRDGGNHLGIDVLAPQGTPIRAAKSGTVTVAGPYYGYGNCVVISNDNSGEEVFYAHMVAVNTTVRSHVKQGDIIGFVGSTGISTANHLHFGVRSHGTWINPLDLY